MTTMMIGDDDGDGDSDDGIDYNDGSVDAVLHPQHFPLHSVNIR